jgi:hypothetical protein
MRFGILDVVLAVVAIILLVLVIRQAARGPYSPVSFRVDYLSRGRSSCYVSHVTLRHPHL